MEPKKKSKSIFIIIIVLIFLISIMGFAYLYIATDLFKSNKELFFQYIKQIEEEKEGWMESNLKEYFKKQKNTPYQNEGNLSMKWIDPNGQTQSDKEKVIQIAFHGQVENSNRLQNISLNYSDTVKFPLNYKKLGNLQGIQTDFIGSKYVVTNGENDILGKDGKILEKIEKFLNLLGDQKEIESIQNSYIKLLEEELQESNFKKIEEMNQKAYQLTLEGERIQDLFVKILEGLKNDQQTLEKINEIFKVYENSINLTISEIDNVIREINNSTKIKEEKLEITVYQTAGELKRLLIKMNEIEWELEKQLIENELEYHFKLYLYQNQIDFVESVEIQDFSKENSMILEDYSKEQVQDFKKAVEERLKTVNQKQMEELGVQENPLQYIIPGNLFNQKKIDEEEVNAFNEKFENYQSTNLQGVTVKGLLSTIQLNNEGQQNKDRRIREIHFDGEEYEVTDQNILLLKSNVELETAYRVEFEKEENTGIIYRAVINKK